MHFEENKMLAILKEFESLLQKVDDEVKRKRIYDFIKSELIGESEESGEDEEISRIYGKRAELSGDQWITIPNGMDPIEWRELSDEEKAKYNG